MTKKPQKRWRPKGSFLDKEKVQKILYVLRNDWTEWEAYSYAWVPKSTFYDRKDKNAIFLDKIVTINKDWMKTYSEIEKWFADAVEEAKMLPFVSARKTIQDSIRNGNAKLAMQFVSKRDDRYKDKFEWMLSWDKDHPLVQIYLPDNQRDTWQIKKL